MSTPSHNANASVFAVPRNVFTTPSKPSEGAQQVMPTRFVTRKQPFAPLPRCNVQRDLSPSVTESTVSPIPETIPHFEDIDANLKTEKNTLITGLTSAHSPTQHASLFAKQSKSVALSTFPSFVQATSTCWNPIEHLPVE